MDMSTPSMLNTSLDDWKWVIPIEQGKMLPYCTLSLHIHHPEFRMQSFITKVLAVCKMPGLQTYQTWQQKIQWIRRYLCCPKQNVWQAGDSDCIQLHCKKYSRRTHSHHDQSVPHTPHQKTNKTTTNQKTQTPHYQQKHNQSEMTRNLFNEVGGKYTTWMVSLAI